MFFLTCAIRQGRSTDIVAVADLDVSGWLPTLGRTGTSFPFALVRLGSGRALGACFFSSVLFPDIGVSLTGAGLLDDLVVFGIGVHGLPEETAKCLGDGPSVEVWEEETIGEVPGESFVIISSKRTLLTFFRIPLTCGGVDGLRRAGRGGNGTPGGSLDRLTGDCNTGVE